MKISNLMLELEIEYFVDRDELGKDFAPTYIRIDKSLSILENEKNELNKELNTRTEEYYYPRNLIFVKNEEEYIGRVKYYVVNNVKSKSIFVSNMEEIHGDAGVCACEILNNGCFENNILNKRFLYIEDIMLNERYKGDDEKDNMNKIVSLLIKFLYKAYDTKNIFARPLVRELNEEEYYIHRYDYFDIERNHYLKYEKYMIGYVKTYYPDIEESTKFINSLTPCKYKELMASYRLKQFKARLPYLTAGMKTFSNLNSGILVFDEESFNAINNIEIEASIL